MITRKEYHAKKGKKVFGKDDCPFCFDFKPIWEGKYWYLIKNISPYSGTDKHLIAVPFEHKKYSTELSSEEFLELKEIHKFVKSFYQDENY